MSDYIILFYTPKRPDLTTRRYFSIVDVQILNKKYKLTNIGNNNNLSVIIM